MPSHWQLPPARAKLLGGLRGGDGVASSQCQGSYGPPIILRSYEASRVGSKDQMHRSLLCRVDQGLGMMSRANTRKERPAWGQQHGRFDNLGTWVPLYSKNPAIWSLSEGPGLRIFSYVHPGPLQAFCCYTHDAWAYRVDTWGSTEQAVPKRSKLMQGPP